MTAREMMEKGKEDTMTVRQAIDLMNERQCHPLGFHLAIVREDMLEKADMFGGDSDGDTPHDLMAQTYDWRWGGQPKRGEYTVKLTAGNMRYIGRAIEVYERVLQDRYQKEVLDEIYGKGHFEESIKKIVQSLSSKEVQEEICDNYCKYTDGYKDADDEKYSDLVTRYCVSCPLNRL